MDQLCKRTAVEDLDSLNCGQEKDEEITSEQVQSSRLRLESL